MPSTSLFGCRLRQLATDCSAFYFLIAVVQVIFFFIYWIGVAAFARPRDCSSATSPQQWAAAFVLLALFLVQAALTCAAFFATFIGTPLEPSKRRWIPILTYAYLASLPINVGLLAWAGWVVEAGDGSCWSSGNKKMPATIVFGAIGVLVGQLVGVLISYNQLGDVRRGVPWHAFTRTGLSSIVHLCGNFGKAHRGPAPGLEEMATEMQKPMCSIDAEKTDVAAGLICAALLQDEAAAAAGKGAVAEAVSGQQQHGHLQDGQQAAAASTAAPAAIAAAASGEGKGASNAGSSAASPQLLAWAQEVCRGASAACPAMTSTAAAGGQAAPVPAGEADTQQALHWARFAAAAYGVRQAMWRRGTRGYWATRRQLSRLAAAAAAEGAQPLAGWGGTSSAVLPAPHSTSSAPAAATRPAAAAAGAPPRPKPPSSAVLRDFAAARELLGPSCQIICISPGDEKRRLLPHLVAVDGEKQAVVLGIAGDWQHPHAVPVVQPTPPSWLAGTASAAAEAGRSSVGAALGAVVDGGTAGRGSSCGAAAVSASIEVLTSSGVTKSSSSSSSSSWVHADSLQAAEVLLEQLERSQLLQRLLLPRGDTAATGGSSMTTTAGTAAASWLQGLDCSGWQLVVSGHGVGAGAAALLALKLQAFKLGPLAVWAHGPPGELCSGDLTAALSSCCTMTSVVVGDDVAPRATSAALGTLVDQSLVGLARLRYSKTGLLAAAVAERLGPQRWEGRWLNPGRALRPLSQVPPEALAYLQRHRDWQQRQQLGARQPSSLPGRVLLLSRQSQPSAQAAVTGDQPSRQEQPVAAAAPTQAILAAAADGFTVDGSSAATSASGGPNCGDGGRGGNGVDRSVAAGHRDDQRWRAVWVNGEAVAGWGIRVSRNATSDHYISRLLGVLGDLAAAAPAGL